MAKLGEAFFARDTLTVTKELLGKYLVRNLDGALAAVRITETEAYVGRVDKACHAYGYKRTTRTEPLFGKPGTVYIYLVYGMYHCLNFVTEPEGEPCAILIRGGQAVLGENLLSQRRYGKFPDELTAYQRKNFLNGPGKLCRALNLTREQNKLLLPNEALWVCDDPADFGLPDLVQTTDSPVHVGPRIGIGYAEEAVHFPWRFWL